MRYGKLKTAFHHFTVIADGKIVEARPDYMTIEGSAAFFAIKVWATDSAEAIDVLVAVGRQVGFDASGRIYVYDSEPTQPPSENPHAYSLSFHQYDRS